MSEQFYDLIIEDEKRTFNIKDETIKVAIKDVAKSYSSPALRDGSTSLEYNLLQNRCAYLFKYAALHTDLVSKYFELMMEHDTIKFILEQKKDLKICCLGGGPGNDVVGIVKALAKWPTCHQKVSEATVLDLCGGWRNSFKHVTSRLKQCKIENVSEEFFGSNFKTNLIEVNLLEKIPKNVIKVLSNADIICMVKFVSAILGKSEFNNAMKVIGNHFKLGAMILFIDNFHGKVFESLNDFSRETGLTTILGPLHESYKYIHSHSNTKRKIYGCQPLVTTRVSVIGWIKTWIAAVNPSQVPNILSKSSSGKTDDNRHKVSDPLVSSGDMKYDCKVIKKSCDKFTQTESKYFKKASKCGKGDSASHELSELTLLLSAAISKLDLPAEGQTCSKGGAKSLTEI